MTTQHLILLGAGHAHVHLLKSWARQALPNTRITLVSPYARAFYSGMVPGWLAGHYHMEQCEINVPLLAQAAGVTWHATHGVALEAGRQQLTLENGQVLDYNLISIDTGAGSDVSTLEAQLPGALAHGVKLRPLEDLARRWTTLLNAAKNAKMPLSVIGGGAASFEIACALRHRLPGQTIRLVSGLQAPGSGYAPGIQKRIGATLARLHIEVLQDRCMSIGPAGLELASMGELPSGQTWVATGSSAPLWLRKSGLALCNNGFIALNSFQQSSSHPQVFAAGDVGTRQDHPHPRSGVYAVRAGPALATNLAAALQGHVLVPHTLPPHTLNLLSCGDQTAIAAYGAWSTQGRWVWRWKDTIDRRFMRLYQG
jgi:pyridine nucleotide-disulfide oxidoreductase family protein